MKLLNQNVLSKSFNFLNFGFRAVHKKFFFQTIDQQAKSKGTILHNHSLGFKINLKMDRIVDREIYTGFFETDTIKCFRSILKPGMTFFDVGGNIGLFSLVAKAKHSDINVYAFEPADEVYVDFQENVKLNNFKNVNIYQKGISDKTGEITFNICEDMAYNSIHSNPMVDIVKTITIETFSIDDFCTQNNINKIDVMKIDTEGAESFVLKGGEKMFSQENAPMLFMEYNRYILNEEQLKEIIYLLEKYGYSIYEIWQGNIRKFNAAISKSYDLICIKPYHFKNF